MRFKLRKTCIRDDEISIQLMFKVDELLKVAKTNFVVMKLAAGGHKHDSQVRSDRNCLPAPEREWLSAVISIYIWSKNLVAESEAKDGGN